MEPFSVTCETCHARLKVRDPQAVGQIHACPKCESMVHIVPPAALDNGTQRQPKADDSITLLATSAASQAVDRPTPLDDFAAAGLDLETISHSAAPITDPPEDLPHVEVATTPAAANPMLPAAAELFWRKVAIWGATGGIGLFLLGGLIGAWWFGRDADPSATPAHSERAEGNPEVAAVTSAVAADEATATPQMQGVDPQPVPLATTAPPDDPGGTPPAAATETAIASTAAEQPLPELPPLPAPETTAQDSPPVATESSPEPLVEEEPQPQPDLDLLSFDPAFLDLALDAARGKGKTAAEPKAPRNIAAPHVASFEPVKEAPAAGAPPHSAGVAQEMGEAAAEVGPVLANVVDDTAVPPEDVRAPVRRGPPTERTGAPVDVAEQLAQPVGKIEIDRAPLDQWLDSMSELLAVPITLGPQALRRAGVAADQPLTFDAAGATAGEILTQVLAQHRLGVQQEHGRLVIVRPGMEGRRTQDYRVAELVANGQRDAQPVADLIVKLIEPGSWEAAGGSGSIRVSGTTLTIEQELGVHLEVLVLLERMLVARELPTKTRYPRERLSIVTSYGQLLPALDAHTTFTFLPWTRLTEVVRYWRDALGLRVLVDWHSLADVDLGPESLVACSVSDQRWEDALDAILAPLDLTWHAVDGRTIQITTRAASRDQRTIEFYPVADLVRRKFSGPDALVTTLGHTLGPAAANAHFAYDAGSGYLLVLGSGEVHRQLTRHLATM